MQACVDLDSEQRRYEQDGQEMPHDMCISYSAIRARKTAIMPPLS